MNSISSCIRFAERMASRVAELERLHREAMAERDRLFRPAKLDRKKNKGFGHGMLPKTQWRQGELRITQQAMQAIADMVARDPVSWPDIRDVIADQVGISRPTLNGYRKKLLAGEILFDQATQKWIPKTCQG